MSQKEEAVVSSSPDLWRERLSFRGEVPVLKCGARFRGGTGEGTVHDLGISPTMRSARYGRKEVGKQVFGSELRAELTRTVRDTFVHAER